MGPPPKPELPVNASSLNGAVTPVSEDHDEKYGVPTLEELGFDTDGKSITIIQKYIFHSNFLYLKVLHPVFCVQEREIKMFLCFFYLHK